MKKFLLSSLIALTSSTLSIHAFANSEKEVIRLINEKQQLELGSSGVVDAATQKFENKVK